MNLSLILISITATLAICISLFPSGSVAQPPTFLTLGCCLCNSANATSFGLPLLNGASTYCSVDFCAAKMPFNFYTPGAR